MKWFVQPVVLGSSSKKPSDNAAQFQSSLLLCTSAISRIAADRIRSDTPWGVVGSILYDP
jgi:hypothetical protein